jgi:hypothetical protein
MPDSAVKRSSLAGFVLSGTLMNSGAANFYDVPVGETILLGSHSQVEAFEPAA